MMLRIAGCLIAALVLTSATPGAAQAPRPWLVPELLAAAKSEGSTLTMYASMNEEEALPYWAIFEQATGIKVNFVRMSDSNIRARVAIEHRAGQRSWDLVATSPVYRLGNEILAPFDPPQAKELIPQARDPNRRWYGYSGNYNTPFIPMVALLALGALLWVHVDPTRELFPEERLAEGQTTLELQERQQIAPAQSCLTLVLHARRVSPNRLTTRPARTPAQVTDR